MNSNKPRQWITFAAVLTAAVSLVVVRAYVAQAHAGQRGDDDLYAGNGPIEVYSEPTPSDIDCFVFDIGGDAVLDAEGALILSIDEGEFEGPDGIRCVVEDQGNSTGVLIDPSTQQTLLRVDAKTVYDPDGRIVLSVRGRHIFEGSPAGDPPLLSANEHISFANAQRKLLLAALIDGHCGAPGWPGDVVPQRG